MKTFVFVVGLLLIAGGVTAVLSPKDFVMSASGPDPASDVSREFLDHVSKERAIWMGYASVLAGVVICILGFFVKKLKTPEPHDNPA